MIGLLNLHKPSGVTSRDVVNSVQRLVRPVKIGHTGTLDPLAQGVLVVCLGPATRLAGYVQRMKKRYRATFLLGRSSQTEDVEGCVTELADAREVTIEEVRNVLPAFRGPLMQRPPAFSALKVAGKRSYELARSGKAIELPARQVAIYDLQLVSFRYPELVLDIECGAGTYIRSLGRDLAERMGSAAVMAALTRVSIGPFALAAAIDPATLTRETLPHHLIDPIRALEGLPIARLSDVQIAGLRQGQNVEFASQPHEVLGQEFAATDAVGRLVAVVQRKSAGHVRAVCNLR